MAVGVGGAGDIMVGNLVERRELDGCLRDAAAIQVGMIALGMKLSELMHTWGVIDAGLSFCDGMANC